MPKADFRGYRFPIAEYHWLPMPELRDGALYVIDARNTHLGVWQESESGFQIARPLFEPRPEGRRMVWHHRGHYPFVEYHWDTGEPLGTVRPLVFVKDVPETVKDEDDLLAYLIRAEEQITEELASELVRRSLDSISQEVGSG